jgi:hypothetical protein
MVCDSTASGIAPLSTPDWRARTICVVAVARFRGLAARGVELQRHLAELLIADQHVPGGDELVLLLVLHDAVLRLLHRACAARRAARRAPPRRGLPRSRARFGLVVEIRLCDGVRDAHGFLRPRSSHRLRRRMPCPSA